MAAGNIADLARHVFVSNLAALFLSFEENLEEKKSFMATARGVPKRSPIQVLTAPDVA